MAGPLAGIRILDLTTVVMGPFATQILGDFGADVVKVEAPGGDSMRKVGPMMNPGMGPLYLQANRNKRSIVLNLKDADDRATLLKLVPKFDVLVYNIRPPAMRRLGLDHETLSKLNPGLIMCGAFGFGETGPYAGRPAYDDIMQAACGISSVFERVNGVPSYAPVNLCDRTVGLYLALVLSSALVHRAKTGEGQAIEVPMFETMAQFVMGDHMGGEAFVPPLGETGYKRLLSRYRGPYPTADGHLCVVIYTDPHWRAFSAMIDDPGLIDRDLRFANLQERTIHSEVMGAFLAERLRGKSSAEWLRLFEAADIPASRVNSIDDLFVDPHLAAVGFWQDMAHPSEGRLRVSRPVGTWSRTPPDVRRLAPRLGEHTQEVLDEFLGDGGADGSAPASSPAPAKAP